MTEEQNENLRPTILTEKLYIKATQSGGCCESPCQSCPYVPRHVGGSTELNKYVKRLVDNMSLENAPNPHFKEFPHCETLLAALKEAPFNRSVPLRPDIRKYFNEMEKP